MLNEGLGFWLPRRRLKSPHKPALVFAETVMTYGELADATDRVARLLLERGTRPGEAHRPGEPLA